MKVNIIMKSGNVYFANLDKAKDIMDVYTHLHLNYDGLMVLNDETIIHPLEIAEVKVIGNNNKSDNKQQDFNITLNINTPVDVEKVMNELAEKLNQATNYKIQEVLGGEKLKREI